jgi:zinc protease
MRKHKLFVIALMCLWLATALVAQKRPVDKLKFPELNKFQLPEVFADQTGNGIKLRVIKNDRLPVVEMTMLIKGGSAFDPPSKVSLAEMTTYLMRIGGTETMKGDEVDQKLDSKGITVTITPDTDFFIVRLSCLKENFDDAVAILADMIRKPGFAQDKLEEAKTRSSSAISRRNDQPDTILPREFAKIIYGEKSPYAAVLEYEHLDNITRDDLVRCHKNFFAPGNIMAGVVGPVELDELKQVMEKHFGDWNYQVKLPEYPKIKEPSHDFKVAFIEKSNLNQSYIAIGHLGQQFNVTEQAKIKVFNLIMAGSFDSRLFNRIRTKMGLTYGVSGGINTDYLRPGVASFGTFTKSESTFAAVNAIIDEINIIRKEKVTQKELDGAIDYFLNSFVFKYSTPGKILKSELVREFYGLPKGYSEQIVEDIKKLTADDILKVAQDYLNPEKMVVMILGKEKNLDGKLTDFGKVKYVDITIKPPVLKEKIPAATPEMLKKGQAIIDNLAKKQYKGYKSLKTLSTVSDATMTMPQGTFNLAIQATTMFPDKFLNVVTIMGMKIETIINGDKGVLRQMGQERAMDAKQIKDNLFGGMYDLIHSKGKYNFQYLKEQEIDGKKYDVIYIFDEAKNWKKIFVNKETGYIDIEEKLSKMPGTTGVAREINSDFKLVKGIPFAQKSETFVGDKKVMSVVVKEVTVNPKVDPAIFTVEKK